MKKLLVILIIFLQYGNVQSQIFQWDEPIKISNNPEGWCILPSICDDSNGNLYVAFSHDNSNENKHLYFTLFDGERWQEVDTLYNEKNYDVYRTNILCDNENNIHLLISIAYGAFGRIYYMKREGNNWSELKQISVDSLGNTSDHDMVIDNTGKIYIFFHSNNIYYRTLKDTVLSDPINLTNFDLNQYTATEPTVAINSHNIIYLSYTLTDNISRVSEIYFKQFNDSQWSDAEILSQINDLSAYNPYITVDQSNNPHVVWRQGQQEELYYILYTTRFKGQWTVPINISNIPNSSSYRPKINLYKGKPIVFFHNINENGEEENYYSYLSDDVWSVSKFDVDINTSLHFNYIISDSDTLHFVTRSSPVPNRATIEYIRGFSLPTSVRELDIKKPESMNIRVYPNPFNNQTKIEFYLDNPEKIELKIFDVTGRLVKTIMSNQQINSGMHFYFWDASNNQGKEVSSGIYLIVFLRNSELSYSRKILLFQ